MKQTLEQSAVVAANLIKDTAQQTAVALNIQYIQKDIVEIKLTLKEQNNTFVSRTELLEIVRVQEDHENRTRILEQGMWKWIGTASAISAIIGIVLPLLLKVLFNV